MEHQYNRATERSRSLRLFLALIVLAFTFAGYLIFSETASMQGNADSPKNKIALINEGIIITRIGSGDSESNGITVQPDGKIIVVGDSLVANTKVFTVVRYNSNGSLDFTFNGNGIITTPIGGNEAIAYSVAVQSDNKILVFGKTVVNSASVLVLIRYNPNGTLDTAFNGTGIVTAQVGQNSGFAAYSFAIQTDGKIVVAAENAVFRFNGNGSPDTAFGPSSGKVSVPSGFQILGNSALKIQPDGKIIVAANYGFFGNGWNTNFGVLRYTTAGLLDTNFNGNGRASVAVEPINDETTSLAIQPDGKIILAGDTLGINPNYSRQNALARFNSDGTLDTTFNGTGTVSSGSSQGETVLSMLLQPDGKILTVGRRDSATLCALTRYNSSGSTDTSFNGTGNVNANISWGSGFGKSVAFQSDGKIVVASISFGFSGYNTVFTVSRFNPDGSTDNTFNGVHSVPHRNFDFDGDGKSDIGIYRPTPAEWWYQRSSDGATRAVQFGSPNDIRVTPADFTGDGRTDIAFFRPSDGNWFVIRSEDSTYFAFPFGSSGDIPAPADFDGDGKADAAVFRPSQGVWYVNKSSGGTSITQFGIAEDKPVVADYDGDAKADIAIFRPSNNSWWHVRSSDGEFRVYQFALGTDKPVIGDWTGDGKADLATYRPTTGEWFIRKSEDLSYYAVPFGAAGDIPAPGDYDGDGKLDTAVYRPSQRTWYINRSTQGILITQFGIEEDKPLESSLIP